MPKGTQRRNNDATKIERVRWVVEVLKVEQGGRKKDRTVIENYLKTTIYNMFPSSPRVRFVRLDFDCIFLYESLRPEAGLIVKAAKHRAGPTHGPPKDRHFRAHPTGSGSNGGIV